MDHALSFGDQGELLDAIERFVTGTERTAATGRVLATVLFTDIVSSTERAAEIGDAQWRLLLERHRVLVRRALSRFDGLEVKTTGDGFLATFIAPSRAIACARAIRDAVAPLGVTLRAGLHTGECELIEDEIGGLAVHIGARVAAAAGPGEILVTRTVHDLVAGSPVGFVDRGTRELRGVPGSWQLFAVE